ncbi:hypothetical protein [Stappia sp. TSB10P1A]|uniref:hypothetical protein n=1 Tax=Stappia sp. TSB10P1A TaxID=2003585 RepID=UPI001643B9C6|nr:hypothetical protein [Stappia sp. TSB10P1A]
MTKIEVVTTCIDTDGSTSREVLYTGEITPRRLARAVSIAVERMQWIRSTFGPGAVRPKHDVVMLLDGKSVDAYEIKHAVEFHGDTWAKAHADLTRHI